MYLVGVDDVQLDPDVKDDAQLADHIGRRDRYRVAAASAAIDVVAIARRRLDEAGDHADAKTHYGRRVRIDALGRCVYSQTPYHHDGKDPNRIFTNVTVVYANIGLTNERKGPDERSHIPQHILRIIDMWNQNIINQTDGVSRDAGDHSCYICKRRERMIDDVFAPIFRCALCLQFSHWACVEMISHELDNSTVLDAADKVQVHPQFLESDDTVCYLCKTVQSEFWSD